MIYSGYYFHRCLACACVLPLQGMPIRTAGVRRYDEDEDDAPEEKDAASSEERLADEGRRSLLVALARQGQAHVYRAVIHKRESGPVYEGTGTMIAPDKQKMTLEGWQPIGPDDGLYHGWLTRPAEVPSTATAQLQYGFLWVTFSSPWPHACQVPLLTSPASCHDGACCAGMAG